MKKKKMCISYTCLFSTGGDHMSGGGAGGEQCVCVRNLAVLEN